ncbi:hypothetical protein [Sphingobium sp. Leaf26]|uniref:hypothetical protein n=1 Tax=Sphingobium sp. Leaf26 TaxID=1735693 RepID=UPI0012E10F73|nr:hypothetical protein [Sphingobium sp. Leaf26]
MRQRLAAATGAGKAFWEWVIVELVRFECFDMGEVLSQKIATSLCRQKQENGRAKER